eukprot:4685561-Pleurochrysis_carterae.AAC.3
MPERFQRPGGAVSSTRAFSVSPAPVTSALSAAATAATSWTKASFCSMAAIVFDVATAALR